MSNKIYRWVIGAIFLLVAVVFVVTGAELQTKSAVHQIYQMLHIICAILCSGFGFLLIKQ